MPFNVFSRARPVRTAFLFAESAGFDAVCDGMAKWSNEFWGGRQSAVALLQADGNLDADAWQELNHFDPDHIYSTTLLSDEILGKLDERIAPWLITESKRVRPGTRDDKPGQIAAEPS